MLQVQTPGCGRAEEGRTHKCGWKRGCLGPQVSLCCCLLLMETKKIDSLQVLLLGISSLELKTHFCQDLIGFYSLPKTLEKTGKESSHFRNGEVENPGQGDDKSHAVGVNWIKTQVS